MWKIIILCFLAAVFEGFDIQSMGVAAPQVAPALDLDAQRMGMVLSASIFGLMIGAAWGGWASDRYGRKNTLMLSLVVFGCFSLLTALAGSFGAMMAIRVATGVGLGGALPNIIAMVSDAAPPKLRVTLLGIVYSGLPIGGAFAGVIAGFVGSTGWAHVFIVGGVGPLLLAPLIALAMPTGGPVPAQSSTPSAEPSETLWRGRAGPTLMLWMAYFFTLLAVYLLLNWLPTLMLAKGIDRDVAPQAAIYLNAGAIIGSLILGQLADRGSMRAILLTTYSGMLLSLIFLSLADRDVAMLACFVAGFFIIGGQLVLYALAPIVYPLSIRGTGIGAAVAVGRVGSALGPLLGGIALSAGLGGNAAYLIAAPGLVLAAAAALLLARAIENRGAGSL